jgi:hypothetical protein
VQQQPNKTSSKAALPASHQEQQSSITMAAAVYQHYQQHISRNAAAAQ